MPKRLILLILARFFNGPFPKNNSNNKNLQNHSFREKKESYIVTYNLLYIIPDLSDFFNE